MKGDIIYINPAAFDILEKHGQDMLGQNLYEIDVENIDENGSFLSREKQPVFNVLKTQNAITDFVQGIIINGSIKWLTINASPVHNEDGSLVGGLSCFTDVTDRVNLEHKYKQSAERNRLLIENVQAVFWEAEIGLSLIHI